MSQSVGFTIVNQYFATPVVSGTSGTNTSQLQIFSIYKACYHCLQSYVGQKLSLNCTLVQDPLFHVDHIRAVTETTQVLRYSGHQCMATSRGILIFILGLKMAKENPQPNNRFYVCS